MAEYNFGYRKTQCNCDTPQDCQCESNRKAEQEDTLEARKAYLDVRPDQDAQEVLDVLKYIKEREAARGKS